MLSIKNEKNKSFYFLSAYSSFKLFLYVDPVLLHYFPSLYRTPFNFSLKASPLATHSLNFCLSKKIFIPPSYLEDNLTGYKIIIDGCLNMSVLALLVFMFSANENLSLFFFR